MPKTFIATPLVIRAKLYAAKAHAGQRYGEFDYLVHLQAAESVLLRFGAIEEYLRAGAWLHDTREDTETTYEELAIFFGTRIADAVEAVTEPKEGDRKARHAATYPKIAKNYDAMFLKLADRISHVEAGGAKVQMYKKEHPEFKAALYYQPTMTLAPGRIAPTLYQMWHYLDSLIIQL